MALYKRRRNYKRRSYRRPRRMGRSLAPRQKVIKCVVTHVHALTTTISSTTTDSVDVNISDITDPFGTHGAQQPLGFDQWATLYKRATVLGVKVGVKFASNDSENVIVGTTTVPEGESAASASTEAWAERPSTNSRLLTSDVDHTYLTKYVSAKRYFNIKNMKDNDDVKCVIDPGAEAAPTRTGKISIWAGRAESIATANSTVTILVRAEYIVLLDQPQQPTRSSA